MLVQRMLKAQIKPNNWRGVGGGVGGGGGGQELSFDVGNQLISTDLGLPRTPDGDTAFQDPTDAEKQSRTASPTPATTDS